MALNVQLIKGTSIDDVHFKLIRRIFQQGRPYIIDCGSYEGHKRLELDYATIHITDPGRRPLSPILPPSVPSITDEESINEYFVKYLMSAKTNKDETYTYSDYIVKQLPEAIRKFKEKGYGTNQATVCVGNEESIYQEHPACLRVIDFFVSCGMLNMAVYFRSWAAWSAFPENIGGLQLLKEYVAQEINAVDGEIFASSKGLHLYDFEWPTALSRLNGVMPEDSIITKEDALLGEGWIRQ